MKRDLTIFSIPACATHERIDEHYNEIGFRLARSQAAFIKSAISSPLFLSPTYIFFFYYYSQLANLTALFSADWGEPVYCPSLLLPFLLLVDLEWTYNGGRIAFTARWSLPSIAVDWEGIKP